MKTIKLSFLAALRLGCLIFPFLLMADAGPLADIHLAYTSRPNQTRNLMLAEVAGVKPPKFKTDRQVRVSVKDLFFGAKGNGLQDDTAAIQKAVDWVYARGGGVIEFPEGVYLVTSVNIREGITYQGKGEAVIKRPDNLFKKAGYQRTVTNQKFAYLGETDSAPIIFHNLIFDGNRDNQGPFQKYEQEHADLLFLMAKKESKGRLRAVIENCTFKNSVSDGISIYKNVSIDILNSRAANCWRGGFLILGGNTSAVVKDFTVTGEAGIDVELGGGSEGYANSRKVELSLENIRIENGFDIGLEEGSIVTGHNIVCSGFFNLVAKKSKVRLKDCKFAVEPGNRIIWPYDVIFENCEFAATVKPPFIKKHAVTAAPFVAWNLSGTKETNQSLTFKNCLFRRGLGIPDGQVVRAILTGWDTPEYNNILRLQGGRISKDIDIGIGMSHRGGTWHIQGTVMEAAMPLQWIGFKDSLGNAFANIIVEGAVIKSNKYMHIYGYQHKNQNRLEHRNMQMDETANFILSNVGIEGNQYVGNRIIWGATPPTPDTHGFLGDIFRLKNSTANWICTKAGYYLQGPKKNVPSAWQLYQISGAPR